MSENPARIVGLPDQGRPLEVGEPANLTVVDPDATWTVAGAELASRSDNTPYESMTLPAHGDADAAAWQGHRAGWEEPRHEHRHARRVADHRRGARGGDRVRDPGDDAWLAAPRRAAGGADRRRCRRCRTPSGPAIDPATGLYVGSTLAPSWQDRIAVGDLGYRTKAVLTRYPEGIMLQRSGGQSDLDPRRVDHRDPHRARHRRQGPARTRASWRSGGGCRRAPRSTPGSAATTARDYAQWLERQEDGSVTA